MNEIELFAPWRLVASFSDGTRTTFDGLTEEQAHASMEAAQHEHGDICYWNRVTDVNYEDGQYCRLTRDAEPLALNVVDFSGYNGPLDGNGFPVGLPDEIARYAADHGSAPDTPQIIVKKNAPPKDSQSNEK